MEIKIKNKAGIKLLTADTLCEEDIDVTLDSSLIPSGKIDIVDTREYDVTQYSKAQIYELNLKPENIKEGVSILGVKGNYSNNDNSNNIFIGTIAEYQEANSKNLISDGMLVHITDDNIYDDEDFYIPELSTGTSSVLGVGVLGKMILR